MEGGMAASPCLLPFPDRFHAAEKFVKLQLPGAKELSQETQLALYSLGKQVHEGPVNIPKPWSWNAVESTKWMAWSQLGNMSAMEAMRLYVRTVDEEQPDWYALLLAEEAKPQNQGAGGSPIPAHAYAHEDKWTVLPLGEQRKPCPRYEQSSGIVGPKMYTVGGNYAGRYLNDLWSFDTMTLTWQQLVPVPATRIANQPAPPAPNAPAPAGSAAATPALPVQPTVVPLAGHTVTVWGDKLVIVGGHVKSKDAGTPLPVRIYHTSCNAWEVVQPSGTSPPPRGGHSSSLVGNKLFIFGGEDASRRALGDLHVLDLSTMMWERTVGVAVGKPSKPQDMHLVKVEGVPPSARSAHAAVVVHDRYIVMFGGGSVATCFSDVHILDTRSEGGRLRWIAANIQGPKVSPRAGHSGALVGSTWYILGGGNNVNGCTDLLALDLRDLSPSPPVLAGPPTLCLWQLGTFPARHALSSEGVSLMGIQGISKVPPGVGPDPHMGMLLAFGGYNGKYQNALNVLRVPLVLPDAPPAVAPGTPRASGPAPVQATPSAHADAHAANGGAAPQSGAKGPASAEPRLAPAGAHTIAHSKPAASNTSGLPGTTAASSSTPAPAKAAATPAAPATNGAAAASSPEPAPPPPPAPDHEKQALRKQLATVTAQLETAQKGMEEARAALGRESAKVLRLEAQAAEAHKKLAMAAEDSRELAALRRQIVEASAKPQGVRAYLGF